MLSFKEFLLESSLTFREITRDDRQFRLELFLRKYKGGQPFETTDGKKVVLSYNPEIEKALVSKDSKTANKIGLVTNDGQRLSFGNLLKSTEFGGGRGSGGGAANTRSTESAQCVYLQAVWENPSTDFTSDDIKLAYNKTYTDATLEEIVGIDEDWVNSSINVARILHKALKKKQYSFHRGSSWVEKLENKFKELNRIEKEFTNINKWTPADIWMVAKGSEGNYDIDGAESLQYLNNELLKAYANRDIIGVSLKKVGKKPKVSQINFRKPFKSPRFKSVSYGKRGFFKSKDGYILYNGGEIQFRTFPTFQCEIGEGSKAKHGKVSHGGIDKALQATTGTKTENRKILENQIRKNRESFLDKFYQYYKSAENNPVSREEFGNNLSSKNVDWLVSKYYVTMIFTTIRGKEPLFMELLYRVAKSQSKLSAVHLKVQ